MGGGYGSPIAKVHGGVQAGGCRALRKVRDDPREGGATDCETNDDPFQMAEDLRRLKRENERLKRENEMPLTASALFTSRQL